MKDAAEDVSENIAEDVVQDLAFGARAARALLATPPPPPPPPPFCAARTEMAAQLGSSVAFAVLGAQLGSSVAFDSSCGQALPGVPRKAPLC